jgi:hypothetical protein
MTEPSQPGIPELSRDRGDRLMSIASAVSGRLATLGPLFAEVIGGVIPHRRMDRIVNVLELLEARVTDIELKRIQERLADSEDLQDLLEEGVVQSTRAITRDRQERIAEMLKNSLSTDELDYMQKKRLWGILGELTDQELILLQYHGMRGHDEDFWERHKDAIVGPAAHMGSTSEEVDRDAVHRSFNKHLVDRGLIRTQFKRPKRGEPPEFDEKTGMMKASGHDITRLGGVLLRHVGLPSSI